MFSLPWELFDDEPRLLHRVTTMKTSTKITMRLSSPANTPPITIAIKKIIKNISFNVIYRKDMFQIFKMQLCLHFQHIEIIPYQSRVLLLKTQ